MQVKKNQKIADYYFTRVVHNFLCYFWLIFYNFIKLKLTILKRGEQRMKQLLKGLIFMMAVITLLMADSPKRALTFDDMMACKRLSAPVLSPDGKQVAFAVTTVDEKENSMHTEIYVMNVDGSGLKQITDGEKSSSSPKWSPKGDQLAYLHDSQIWVVDKNMKNPKQVSDHYTGASSFEWAPNGKLIAFETRVYPGYKDM